MGNPRGVQPGKAMAHCHPSPAKSGVRLAEVFPVRRIYCVGRNYVEHAKEMGFTGREPPFFFLKPADATPGRARGRDRRACPTPA
jgi:2-keto-4-pentenoate hydratase/2-oxohepta-3-ene-1,7-dioic acid hydratase in catechol pathway